MATTLAGISYSGKNLTLTLSDGRIINLTFVIPTTGNKALIQEKAQALLDAKRESWDVRLYIRSLSPLSYVIGSRDTLPDDWWVGAW